MKWWVYSFILFLTACSSSPYIHETHPIDSSQLPPPNITLTIPNLSPCTDAKDTSMQIDTKSPITILVHGCKGSAGRFRSLAQLYAFHGQQAFCFSYDDRDSLVATADKLGTAVLALSDATQNQHISIMGHSMGGLVARKAMEQGRKESNSLSHKNLELITISAPLSGIEASSHCGLTSLHWLTAGLIPGICWLVTGDNWNEIPPASDFIQHPKPFISSIKSYLKIVTNEVGTCRRQAADGSCVESDYVFDLAEQYHPKIDNQTSVTNVEVAAGHVAIIGNKNIVPRKLLSILQDYGLIAYTPANRIDELEKLFAQLY